MTPKASVSKQKQQQQHVVTSHAEMRGRPRPSQFEIWKTAARPHTLTASLCPCLVSIAAVKNAAPVNLTVAWILFCVTVQIGTNLHNDYSDFVKGADTDKRVGHARATAQGWLTPEQTCQAATGVLTVTLATGVYVATMTRQLHNPFLWFLILSSVFNAFAYTGGPYPLGYLGLENVSIAYYGLGDIFVFLYFGLTATLMLPYLVHVVSVSDGAVDVHLDWPRLFLYSAQVGLLGTNIIVVNNLRDRHTDVSARKRTTSVRFGRSFSVTEYVTCLVMSYSLVLVDCFWLGTNDGWNVARLLPLLSLPLARREMMAVIQKDGAALNEHVGGTAKVQFLFCILLSLGLWLS
jgi:1,4-dihydroxy-2-naphthoate octaprenyltransferase